MMKRFWKWWMTPSFEAPAILPKHDLQRLQARVGLLAADDPLWPMLKALARANVEIETEILCRAGISSDEAHRGRGRVGMLLDLEAQLNQVWADSHRAT